ncbi:hypothetical protein NP233_g3082 [Leucocoprinus birnbaumii]|uniref:Arylamine N-acetyltransferase n=1 Tax=Leucocoprinus birnbaumii TaxID=56174 RepID=A0AAD5YWR2_9AGAR|nr:hypothetical protein NP233_g3082 [Leucocoprinus birnbaumii]
MVSQSYPASGTLRDGILVKAVPSKLTSRQIADYLLVIGYDSPLNGKSYEPEEVAAGAFCANIEELGRLITQHLLTFPFENTSMHYTPDHEMEVTPELLFPRFVRDKSGSYCYGQNGIFLEVLRGLGYRAYAVSARVSRDPDPDSHSYAFGPLSHLILLVQLQYSGNANQTYAVDVGFGSACLMRPILLSANPNNIVYGLTNTERHRLVFEPSPNSSISASSGSSGLGGGQWNLEVGHRESPDALEIWHRKFSFTESECWQPDIDVLSFAVSQRPGPRNLFYNTVICVKVFQEDKKKYRIILNGNEVKKSYGAKSEVMRTFNNELERIRALREIFGLKISDEDEVHIRGRPAALNSQSRT